MFGHKIPHTSKKKLTKLQNSDVSSVVEYQRDRQRSHQFGRDPEARSLFNLSKFYSEDEVVAMSWTLYHNAALSLHRSEKESKFARISSIWYWVNIYPEYQ